MRYVTLLKQRPVHVGIFVMLALQFSTLTLNPESFNFASNLSILYNLFAITAAVTITVFAIRGRGFHLALLAGLLAAWGYLFLYVQLEIDMAAATLDFLNHGFVANLLPLKFVEVSVDGMAWALLLSVLAGLFFMARYLMRKRFGQAAEADSNVQQQLIVYGTAIYSVLIVLIWIFTHFTFVCAGYIYMHNNMMSVDQVVKRYAERHQTENFGLPEIRHHKSKEEMLDALKSPLSVEKYWHNEQAMKIYYTAVKKLEKGYYTPKISYDTMTSFNDWIQIALNARSEYASAANETMWRFERIGINDATKAARHDYSRHLYFYVRPDDRGGWYSYVKFDKTFKEQQQNAIFNFAYLLFHLVYVGLLIYLVKIHSRKNLKKGGE